MFIYGVGFTAASTYTITVKDDIDPNITFLVPLILSAVTIAFSFSMVFNCTLDYRKILLGIVRDVINIIQTN